MGTPSRVPGSLTHPAASRKNINRHIADQAERGISMHFVTRWAKQSVYSTTYVLIYSIGHKKATPQNNVRFFSNFSWWFKMLPLLFELLNQPHKRPVQLGKRIKKATKPHTPLSKDLNLSTKKHGFFWGGGAKKPQEKCQKGFL
jgi:hypothetical protein